MSALRRTFIATVSLGLAAGMLTAAPAEAGQTALAAGPGVDVRIKRDHTVLMPDVNQGVTKFVVESARFAAFQIAEPAPGYTRVEAARDIRRGLERGHLPAMRRFERNVTLLGGVSSSPGNLGRLWVDLAPGKYWGVDTSGAIRARGLTVFRALGAPSSTVVPDSSRIRAIDSTTWGRAPATIPNRGVLTLKNNSDQNHFVILVKLQRGKDMGDFRRWIRAEQMGEPSPPPVSFRHSVESGVVSPGNAMSMRYRVPEGRYAMICFWPDASMGGMPHAFMGMYRGITLT